MVHAQKPVASAEELLSKLQDLPSLPAVVMRVYQMADDPAVHAHQIALEIGKDQGFATRVLRVANSAYYGLSRQVGTLEEAVVVLGMHTVKNLALIAATYPLFQRTLLGYTPHTSGLWTHSMAVGLIAQLGARTFDTPIRNEAFTAGLLHDVGKLVISTALSDWMGELYDRVVHKRMPVHQAEQELFGFTHEEVGALLIDRWKLPQRIALLVQGHHQSLTTNDRNCALIEYADYCANQLGYCMNPDAPQEPFDTRVLNVLGITLEESEQFLQRANEMLRSAQGLMQLK